MGELLPVLVADLGTEQAARALEGVAQVAGEAWVPLVAAPSEAGRHLLEVYIPSWSEPLRLLAEPLGATGELGHALRLFPYEPYENGEDPGERAPKEDDVRFVSAAPRDAFIGRLIAGDKLQIESLIGRGSIGAVYRARHIGLHLPIAVKVLHGAFQHDVEFCRRFYAEALAMSRLDHPNVVRVQDFGQEADGLLYLSMAFLDGRSLRTILEQEGPLEPGRAMKLMLQVSAGLSHAHSRGLIHRDVKADNVMVVAAVDDDGMRTEQAKVCDFGFAVPPSVSGEVAQRLAGTPVYMSPEQCRGEELDGRTDLYACGILLYELLTGEVPFLTGDPREIMRMHVTVPPPLVAAKRPGIDPRIDRLVQRALAKSREDRHANLQELRTELKAVLRGEAPGSAGSLAPPSPRSSRPSLSPTSPKSEGPEWLERSQGYDGFLTGMESARADETADTLSRDPRPWLKKLVEERDGRAFVSKISDLERAVRTLAQRADVRTLFAVMSAVHGLASEQGPRATLAASVLALFGDPELLAPIAERLLSRDDEMKENTRTLVTNARGAGAYALYGARVKLGGNAYVRVAFVTTMQRLGEDAWPVVRAALARIPDAAMIGGHPAAAELAEDLLLCVPAVRDDAAGELVVRYASATVPSLCRAAARAITRLWAERARPILLGLVDVPDDGVRTAAIAGLREIGAVDVHAVRRITPLLTPDASGASVRAAAIAALASTTDEARSLAANVLAHLVATPLADDATVLTAARALVAVAGASGHDAIRQRASLSVAPLRGQLIALVGGL